MTGTLSQRHDRLGREGSVGARPCGIHAASTEPDGSSIRVPLCARETFGALRRRTSAGMVPRADLPR